MFFRHAATSGVQRNAQSLPFGWGAVTVLLIGAVLTIIGIVIILYGMLQFFSGTIGNATSGDFNIGSFFSGFFGAIVVLVIGAVLAGVGGWLVHLWWIFLLVDVASGAGRSTGAVHDPSQPDFDVRIRCRTCGRLNPESARTCASCLQPL